MEVGEPKRLILIIDNNPSGWKGEFKLPEVLKENFGDRFRLIHYSDKNLGDLVFSREVEAVISGGSPDLITRPEVRERFQGEIDLLRRVDKPLLGICHGHQLLALSYGGEVERRKELLEGFLKIEVVRENPIFKGLGNALMGWKEHREEVKTLPKGFILLARSEKCGIEAIRHKGKPIYGLQFHPEKFDSDHPKGLKILRNFMEII